MIVVISIDDKSYGKLRFGYWNLNLKRESIGICLKIDWFWLKKINLKFLKSDFCGICGFFGGNLWLVEI